MAFTGCFLQFYHGLLLKEHLPKNQEKLEHDYLEHHCEKIIKAFCLIKYSNNLFLLTGEARLSTLTQSRAPSPILLKVSRNFKGGLHFDILIQVR